MSYNYVVDKDWIPVLGTLLGVLFGGGISSFAKWLELRHQKKEEHNKLMRSKLEELYQLILEFQRTSFLYYATVHRTAGNSITAERMNEIAVNMLEPINKINTMISFYTPDLNPLLENLTSAILTLQNYGLLLLQNKANDHNQFRNYFECVSDSAVKLLEEIQDVSTTYIGLSKPIKNKIIETQ